MNILLTISKSFKFYGACICLLLGLKIRLVQSVRADAVRVSMFCLRVRTDWQAE